MSRFHACLRTDEVGRPLPTEEMTCGSCRRSWCRRCDPTPASLCPFCNGAERLVGNPVIDPDLAWFAGPEFIDRLRFNVREATMPEWARAQVLGAVEALLRHQPSDRDVLVGLARAHPHLRDALSELMDAAGLDPLRYRVEVTAEVTQKYSVTEVLCLDDPDGVPEMLGDMMARGELSDGDLEDSTVRVVRAAVVDLD